VDSLFDPSSDAAPRPSLAEQAGAAADGHFDEVRGAASPGEGTAPTAAWADFFQALDGEGAADLDRRRASLERQVRDNGVTYNVYADTKGPQRPWSLDLFPLIVTPDSWRQIEAGVLQRMHLLEGIMADVYGPQRLIAGNLLPPALVHGHPGYLRALHGTRPAGGRHLHLAAFDIARDAQGRWWVVSQRTQAPSGLGYLLENRQIISRQFSKAFDALHVQRLAGGYGALVDGLRALSAAQGQEPRIVLLTPGPYNETYFEHAFLARHLGLTLVEGSDLTVRSERLYLKTLHGLEPVHGILKRLDDEFLDPLELRADSRLGVPGLMQAIRAGNVLVANAPGSAFLESPALLGFLPALSRHLLKQELQLPSVATWWCGERAALDAVLPQLGSHVIKPTYTGPGSGAVLGHALSRRALDEWGGRLTRQPDDFTVQAYLPLSQIPTWSGRRIAPRSLLLRVFVMPDSQGAWRVLPGGLTRLASGSQEVASMQRGGSSADTWVLTDGEVDRTPMPATVVAATGPASQPQRVVTSRAAENLFWMGRYTERTENTARLARLVLHSLRGDAPSSAPLMAWIDAMASGHALVRAQVPPPSQSRRVFERSLVAALADTHEATSVGFNLRGLRMAASAVRERLSQEQWNLIERAEQEFLNDCAQGARSGHYDTLEALRVLERLSARLDAMTGAQTDRMTRDDGWRLLSTGRHLERLAFLASALARGFETGAVHDEGGFEALLALFDSSITYQALYQKRQDVTALIDLLVLDRDNPRSLAWVTQTLVGRLARVQAGLGQDLPDPQQVSREALCARDAHGHHARLLQLLHGSVAAAYRLSDELSTRCFNHADDTRRSVGA